LWINSLDIDDLYVNNLYEECRDGQVLLKVIHKINPNVVEWNRVEKNPNNTFKKGVNCQVAFDACQKLKLKLMGIGASDIQDGNKKLVLAIVWQLVRIHYLQIIGNKTDQDIIAWANSAVPDMKITSFKDKNLQDGRFLIKLAASIEPRVVNWELVTEGATEEDRMMNAKYAISIARKLGAIIFLVWDDVVELNQKMLLIFIASLYDLKM
jgi:plastin-1